MKPKHRKILSELCQLCNQLGGILDGTSTHESKYKDRQRALMDVYAVLYGVLTDVPENDDSETGWEMLENGMSKLRELSTKKYPDRKGNYI
jgi:hypothetical protein